MLSGNCNVKALFTYLWVARFNKHMCGWHISHVWVAYINKVASLTTTFNPIGTYLWVALINTRTNIYGWHVLTARFNKHMCGWHILTKSPV